MLEINSILPGSTADGLGLKAGDVVDAINGKDVRDVIDYQYLIADEKVRITLHAKDGRRRTITLTKDPDDTLGLEFLPFPITRCRNRCIFCFVDQMPPGCRRSLYVKDDDYRASFLHGNYITLGALTETDLQRIFDQRLSPLYISVHATDPALRSFMLRNKKAPDIMASLRRLAAGGIRMHTQIVLCPGINDGPHLRKTIEDLAGLFPAVSSIAVVPVGLTAFRKGRFPLRTFTRREARAVIDDVVRMGRSLKNHFGMRLVFASDEFYIKAGMPVPSLSFYEDLPQVENGVGMVAGFLRESKRAKLPKRVAPIKATVVTGVSFKGVLRETLERVNKVNGVRIRTVVVRNRFFGPSVTVAGLLTGRDILNALKDKRLGDLVMVPANALKEDEAVFLDNMTLDHLMRSLHVRVVPVAGFGEMIWLLRREGEKAS